MLPREIWIAALYVPGSVLGMAERTLDKLNSLPS